MIKMRKSEQFLWFLVAILNTVVGVDKMQDGSHLYGSVFLLVALACAASVYSFRTKLKPIIVCAVCEKEASILVNTGDEYWCHKCEEKDR